MKALDGNNDAVILDARGLESVELHPSEIDERIEMGVFRVVSEDASLKIQGRIDLLGRDTIRLRAHLEYLGRDFGAQFGSILDRDVSLIEKDGGFVAEYRLHDDYWCPTIKVVLDSNKENPRLIVSHPVVSGLPYWRDNDPNCPADGVLADVECDSLLFLVSPDGDLNFSGGISYCPVDNYAFIRADVEHGEGMIAKAVNFALPLIVVDDLGLCLGYGVHGDLRFYIALNPKTKEVRISLRSLVGERATVRNIQRDVEEGVANGVA